MKPHISYAHQYWARFVRPGDTSIDATLGNGHDTLYLAQLLKGEGRLIGYDIQPQALEQAKRRIEILPDEFSRIITLKFQSHTNFEEKNVKLIVYNLGYLPGGDKSITTLHETTLISIQNALHCLTPGGAISITCYPGHTAGAIEQEVLIDFLKTLPSNQWEICHHVWLNRPFAPSLILLSQRAILCVR
jgi:hypothetical protein